MEYPSAMHLFTRSRQVAPTRTTSPNTTPPAPPSFTTLAKPSPPSPPLTTDRHRNDAEPYARRSAPSSRSSANSARGRIYKRNKIHNSITHRAKDSFRGTPGQLTFRSLVDRLRKPRTSATLAAIHARCVVMAYVKEKKVERFGGKVTAEMVEAWRRELGRVQEAFGGELLTTAPEFAHLDGQMEGLAGGEEVVYRCCECGKAGRARMVGEGEEVCRCGHVCCILCLYVQREEDEMIEMELLSLEEPGKMDGKMGGRKDDGDNDDGGMGGGISMAMEVGA